MLRRFVLNGSLATEPYLTWDELAGPYLAKHLPALKSEHAEVIRFRAKLPPSVTSLALAPHISFHEEGPQKRSVASRIAAATRDKSGALPSSLSSHADLPFEWDLAITLPSLPESLVTLELKSEEMVGEPAEISQLLSQVPVLTRLAFDFKCILSPSWTSELPTNLISLRLEQAICAEETKEFELTDFPSTIVFLHLPCMFVKPPFSPTQIPPKLVRLHMANSWSTKMIELVKIVRPVIVVSCSQLQKVE